MARRASVTVSIAAESRGRLSVIAGEFGYKFDHLEAARLMRWNQQNVVESIGFSTIRMMLPIFQFVQDARHYITPA